MLVGFRSDVTKRQTWPVVLTVFEAVLAIKKYFSRQISTLELFYRELRSKVEQTFQHKSENRVKMNICQCVTLGRRVCFRSQDIMFVGSAF